MAAKFDMKVEQIRTMARKLGMEPKMKKGKKPVQGGNGERKPGGGTNLGNQLTRAKNLYIERLRLNPPGIICWLKGGLNSERAGEIKKEIESR